MRKYPECILGICAYFFFVRAAESGRVLVMPALAGITYLVIVVEGRHDSDFIIKESKPSGRRYDMPYGIIFGHLVHNLLIAGVIVCRILHYIKWSRKFLPAPIFLGRKQ